MSEPCHASHYSIFLVFLAEVLTMLIKRMSSEKGWWHRLPFNSSVECFETDSMMPSLGVLFSLPNALVTVTFTAVGSCAARNERLVCA